MGKQIHPPASGEILQNIVNAFESNGNRLIQDFGEALQALIFYHHEEIVDIAG